MDRQKILIVDDEELVSNMLRHYLEDCNLIVSTAPDGARALELVSGGEFHAAVIDMRLPDISGEDLILRIHEIQPDIRLFIHTGSIDYMLSPGLRNIGLDENSVFHKPVDDMFSIHKKLIGLKENQ